MTKYKNEYNIYSISIIPYVTVRGYLMNSSNDFHTNGVECSKQMNNIDYQSVSNDFKVIRALKDLNLIDAFLFNASTEKTHDAEIVARIVVERATGQKLGKVIVQSEKQLKGLGVGRRGVRLDLFISELDNEKIARVYDIEPNNYDFEVLPYRDRYNQALSDVKLLQAGSDFRQLPEYILIWILPTDPFGDERMIYTVKNMVAENQKLVYNDGVKRIFLNAKGSIGGNERLGALLNYFCDSCEDNVTDPELEELHSIVNSVKHSEEVGERYMSYITWEELARYEVMKRAKIALREEVKAEVAQELRTEVAVEVTEQITKEVTEQITKELKDEAINSMIRAFIRLGITKENIVEMLKMEYQLSNEQAIGYIRAFQEAAES